MPVWHPFHPLGGCEFELIRVSRYRGAEQRSDGTLQRIPVAWTSLAAVDPFVVLAAGRSPFRVRDLLVLADLIEGIRLPAHPARGRTRPTFCLQRLLRPVRSAPGQVRDAAPGTRGGGVGERGHEALGALATDVLVGAAGLRVERPARPPFLTPRAAGAAQARARGGRGTARGARGAAPAEFVRARGAGARPVRDLGAPVQHRPRSGAEKQPPVTDVRRRRAPSDAGHCTIRYEQLRDRAVRAGPVQDRNGVAVLARRGVAAWLGVLAGLARRAPPVAAPSGKPLAWPTEIEANAFDILLRMVRPHLDGRTA